MATPNTYLIIQSSDISNIDITQLVQTAIGVRYSLDGSKAIIKWKCSTPSSVMRLQNTEGPYTEQEILQIVDNSFWTIE